MKKNKDLLAAIVAVIAVIITILFATITMELKVELKEGGEKAALETAIPTSQGERETEIYTIEFWDDGSAKVTTYQGYINQLSDNTLLITDKSYDEVINEMIIAEDLQEVDE